jgi:hypothetical protein
MAGTQPPRPIARRSTARGERAALVDRLVSVAVREGLKDEWTVHEAALALLDHSHDAVMLKLARARVSEVVLKSPSLAGTRAVTALNVVLGRLQADVEPEHPRVVPVQRHAVAPPFDPPAEQHLVRAHQLSGSPDSIGGAAAVVAESVCRDHASTEAGRAMLVAQELLVQTVGRAMRPAHVVLTCDGQVTTVYVDLAAEGGREQLTASTPDLALVEQLADDWGAECLRPGVRYWAAINL